MRISHVAYLLLVAGCGFLIMTRCGSKEPPVSERSPFQSVALGDDFIVVTLPDRPRWMVIVDSGGSRISEANESFVLKPGSSLVLSGRHLTFRVVAELSPRQGLRMEAAFDGRSFGDELTIDKYFLPAGSGTADMPEAARPSSPSD